MATAYLGHNPPFDGAAWLNGTAATAVKDILGAMLGPKQYRYAMRARNGTLDGFIHRLAELESRR